MPTFSIVIPTYNHGQVVARALQSVLDQTYSDLEAIVVDDGSTDDTAGVVAKFDDRRVRYLRQENAGVSCARNTGAAAAGGTFVLFLDSDDEALPTWLERLASHAGDPSVGLITCGCTRTGASERVFLPLGRALCLPGTFAVRRDIFDESTGYVPGLRGNENTELKYRLLPLLRSRGLRVAKVSVPLIRWNIVRGDESRYDTRFMEGATYILEHHGERLQRNPRLHANYHAIAGVGRIRQGEFETARRHFWSALRVCPRQWKHWIRLAVAYVPPLAKRTW